MNIPSPAAQNKAKTAPIVILGINITDPGTQAASASSGTGSTRPPATIRDAYVKIAVSTFLCALLLIIGVPVFMESRVTGSLAYTALCVVLVGFGLVLAAAVVALLFHPPFNKDGTAK